MREHHGVDAWPLAWPHGWPRTAPRARRATLPGGASERSLAHQATRLRAELGRLGATHIVLSTNQQVRGDGIPYALRSKLDDPGAAVYFVHGEQPLVMAQDAFSTLDDNVRSLALAIEALRQLKRHGGGTMLERAFSGFLALPAPPAQWRTMLGVGTGDVDETDLKRARARLMRRHHPDRAGGDTARTQAINRAYEEGRDALGLSR